MSYLLLDRPIAYPLNYDGGLLWGLGDATQAAQYTQIGGSIAAPVVSAAFASSAASSLAAGGSGLILGMAPALAVPVIGAAIAGVTILAALLIKNSGCGQTCIVTSQWANEAEKLLQQNLEAYFSNPAPRNESMQNAAVANFTAIWTRLQQMCSDPSTGDAGQRCISDRDRGACIWKQTADSTLLGFPGEPQPGECWNWFVGYLDPILHDPDVVPDTITSTLSAGANQLTAAANQAAASVGLPANSGSYLLLGLAALVLLGVVLS